MSETKVRQVKQASLGGSIGIMLAAGIGYAVYPNPMAVLAGTLIGVAFLAIAIRVVA